MIPSVEVIRGAIETERETLPVIVGPTASGKTELALQVAEAVGGEIINVDSVQIVRGFDIGSGKPTSEELARVPHHLIDAVSPLDPIDAQSFAEMAHAKIAEIQARGKRPILAGGTFLWHRAILFGLADAPPADHELRERQRELVREHGALHLHALLSQRDPEMASRLHPNDVVRVGRALEVFELTGRRLSEIQGEHGFRKARYPSKMFAINQTKETLSERIERRAATWLESGFIEEVDHLIRQGYAEARAMDSVGYREVRAFVRGEMQRADLLTMIVRSTRVFARRQRTWLNGKDVVMLDPTGL